MRLLLTFEYPFHALGYGGGHQITRGLARALARQGHEVHVACTGVDELGVAAADSGVQYHFGGSFSSRSSPWRAAAVALPLVHRLRPHIVCSFTSEAAIVLPVARAAGARTLMYLAAPDLKPFRPASMATLRDVRRSLGQFLQFIGCGAAHRILTLSDYLADQATARWGIAPCRLEAVGLGLDDAICATPVVVAPTLPPGGLHLVSVGRLSFAQKPLDVAATALALAPDTWSRWSIVGAGEDDAALRAHVERLGIGERVEMLGTLPSADVSSVLDRAHAAILPSRYESFFLSVYEAAARGRPVLTSMVADIARDFARNPSVRALPVVQAAAFAQVLREWRADYPGVAARALADAERVRLRLTWDQVATRVLEAAHHPRFRDSSSVPAAA